MKKVTSMLLCAAMLLSLAACGSQDPVDSIPDGSSTAASTTETSNAGAVSGGDTATGESSGGVSTADASRPNGGTSGQSSAKTTATTGTQGGGSRQVVNNCYTTGYPIAKDPVTFKIMIRDHANGLAKYNDSPLVDYIKAKMNITLDFEAVPPTDMVVQKMTTSYASNNMPDMFWGMAPASSVHTPFIKQGKVTEIGQYIDEYAPNVKKMLEDVPAAKYLTTFDDGKTYMFPMVNDPDESDPGNYSFKLFINKTWLNNVGKSMPTTTDELRDVLIAFRDQDANKNGDKNDEIPMTFGGCGVPYGDIPPSLFGPFGVSTYLNWMNIDQQTNKIEYTPITDEYKNGLKYFADLYKEKLLDNNFRGKQFKDVKQLTSAKIPTVGVFAATSWGEGVSAENYLAHYTVMPPLKGPAGSDSTWSYVDTEKIWAEWFVVTKNCKYPEIAVRLADYFYSTEGTAVALYGPPGDDYAWNYDEDGNFVPNYSKTPAGKSYFEWTYMMTPGYPIPHYNSKEYYQFIDYTSSNPTAEEKADAQYESATAAMFKNVKPDIVMPKLSLTAEESTSISDLGGYASYVAEMRYKFISGENIDSLWSSYVANVKKLGVDKMLEVNNQAYNRYRDWMKNNGK